MSNEAPPLPRLQRCQTFRSIQTDSGFEICSTIKCRSCPEHAKLWGDHIKWRGEYFWCSRECLEKDREAQPEHRFFDELEVYLERILRDN